MQIQDFKIKEMETELIIFIKTWIWAITCLSYSYYMVSKILKPFLRLLSLLPVFFLLLTLPSNLSTVHLGASTIFFLSWLAVFKLLLFSFHQGPLSSSPPPPTVLHFIALACLPIKPLDPSHNKPDDPPARFSLPGFVLLPIKACLLAVSFRILDHRHHMNRHARLGFYCVHLYLELEIALAVCAIPARALFGFDLEPQFDEPYLATSLQDFWGRRWNLMVSNILRPTVHDPVKSSCGPVFGPKWAALPAIMATFVVSGLMHELIYFYVTRARPTWEVTWFFVLHGICVALEVAVKKVVRRRWELHRLISGPLTVAFLAVTGDWLFFPQLIRNGVIERVLTEYSIFYDFLKEKLWTKL